MTTPSPDRITKSIGAVCSEFFDGYVVVGYVAGSNEPVIVTPKEMDPKQEIALSVLLIQATYNLNKKRPKARRKK